MSSKLVVCCGDIAIFRIFKMVAAAILDFWNCLILLAVVAKRSRHISMPNFIKIGQSVEKILRFFRFLKMAAAILDCRIHKILLADRVQRRQTHHCTKFHQNQSFHCGDIAISQIFKMAATAIWYFWNREILLAIVVERVQTHQHAKFRQNRSVSCEDIEIF